MGGSISELTVSEVKDAELGGDDVDSARGDDGLNRCEKHAEAEGEVELLIDTDELVAPPVGSARKVSMIFLPDE
ncbi:hypothetical protein WR25_06253 [Diploscapter pachys]|uniref:Uncharacterized protein n=1 Tax=Diploscapter pachys TaxID=2018661 RepID=A0A2A2LXA0_9BILA|nr:hypothetical protein WR25_06253 [Diploscapter pachys]